MKIKCKKIFFHIPRSDKPRGGTLISWLCNNLPAYQLTMSAHSRRLKQQNIIDRTHTWQQYSVTILEDILTTKCGFTDRLCRKASKTTTRILLSGDWRQVSVAHAPINRRNHKVGTLMKRNKLVPSPIASAIQSVHLTKGPRKQSKQYSANFSARQTIVWQNPAHGLWPCVYLYCANNSTGVNAGGFPHVGNRTL